MTSNGLSFLDFQTIKSIGVQDFLKWKRKTPEYKTQLTTKRTLIINFSRKFYQAG